MGVGGLKPRLLDLFCGQGGASAGYVRAGFEVIGVDINEQRHYPFQFIQSDALTLSIDFLSSFDVIHASPPCQARTMAQRIRRNEHPNLISPTRGLLDFVGLPYVIENVVAGNDDPDPLMNPVVLCGSMFNLQTYRHREFETNWKLLSPVHPEHAAKTTKMGREPVDGEYMHIVGNFSGVDRARGIMGMPWATRDGLREAIPPAYTEFIGKQLIEYV